MGIVLEARSMNRDEGIAYVLRKVKEKAVTNDTVTTGISGDCLDKHKRTARLYTRDA